MNRQAVGKIARFERAIIERLKPEFPSAVVDAWPDTPEQYQLLHNKGAVLVSYRGRSAVEEQSFCCNGRVLTFNIIVIFRNLRQRDAHQGVYDALEILDNSLTDWEPEIEGCGAFEFVRDGFTREDAGVWMYSANFSIECNFERFE
jgi:hypothetical protein